MIYLEFEVTLKDCPVGNATDQCQVVGQRSEKPRVEIPPNQKRIFTALQYFPNLPLIQGQRFFSWRIAAASSCSQDNLKAHQCAKTDPPSEWGPAEPQRSAGTPQPLTASPTSPTPSRGWIGVEIQPVTPEIADAIGLDKAAGAIVAQAQTNSPAVMAGIKSGDVITAVNGKPVGDARQLALLIATMTPGTTVSLDLIRDGRQKIVSLTLGTLPN